MQATDWHVPGLKIYKMRWSSKNMDEQEIEGFTEKATSWIKLFVSNKRCYTVYACAGCTCTKIFTGCWKPC